MPTRQVAHASAHGTAPVVGWFDLCRKVCSQSIDARAKMIGTKQNPFHVDESYFSGKRKYIKGRLLASDQRSRLQEYDDLESEMTERV